MGCVPILGSMKKTSRMGFAWDSRLPKRPYPWRFAWFSWPQQPIFVSKSKVFCLKSHGERIVPMDPNKIDFLRYLTQIIGQTLPEFRRHGWIGCCKTIFMIFFFKMESLPLETPKKPRAMAVLFLEIYWTNAVCPDDFGPQECLHVACAKGRMATPLSGRWWNKWMGSSSAHQQNNMQTTLW